MNKISELKEKIKASHNAGIALDIDETLSWTIGYWVEQMLANFGNPENLTIEQVISKYRYTQNVPYWQTEEALQWMHDHREDNTLQRELPLIENSQRCVNEINMTVPIVAYITTRPTSVISGTKDWLNKHSFPNAEIIARPKEVDHSDGNKWKAEVLEELYPVVQGIVDDNPGLVEHLSAEYRGRIYLYNFYGVCRDDLDIVKCSDWTEVEKSILGNSE